MKRPLVRPIRAAALTASLLLASVACGPTGSKPTVQRPAPTAQGTPVASPVSRSVGPDGGTIASADGRLTVRVPKGALTTAKTFSIQPITNTAPRGVGSAYRLEPSGTTFATPVAITFRTDSVDTPTARIGVSYQDAAGYWIPVLSVLRNSTAKLVTVSTGHFSDWTLVPTDPTQDLAGTFTVSSTLNAPAAFTAVGNASLAYVGEDAVERVYMYSGTATLQPLTVAGATCTPNDSATHPVPTNIAEAFIPNPSFSWGTSTIWSVTCGSSPQQVEMVFDTAGISHIGCARGYTLGASAPVTTHDIITGDYTIDCSGKGTGTLRATWSFQRCGATCTSANPCATGATVSCTASGPVCTVTSTAPVGTACTISGTAGVCNDTGTCTPCSAGAACTSTNPCATSATTQCSTGVPVCADQTFAAAGTPCSTSTVTGVCSTAGVCTACTQGAACTSSNPCALTAAINCSSGAPVCTDQALQPGGTACTTPGGATGVCSSSGVCTACTQGASCTSSNPCALTATIDCSTGTPVCTDRTFVGTGTSCGTNAVCSSTGVCSACTAGVTCTSANPCALTATTSCSTGTAVCTDQSYQPAGTACTTSGGVTGVCSPSGICTACTQGAACTSTNPCVSTATMDCSTGTPVCTDQTYLAAGTSCTSGSTTGVCSTTGTCTACTPGATCTTSNPCDASASIVCTSGGPVCTATATSPDGTVCNSTTNSVCIAGTCDVCVPGASCTPAVACDVGTMSCGDPTTIPPTPPSCVDTGVSNCPTGQTCNVTTGTCG